MPTPNAVIYNNLGEVLFAKKDYSSALKNYNLALELNPQYTKAKLNMIRVLIVQENRDEARKQVFTVNANQIDLKKLKANILFELGELKEAKALMQDVIKDKSVSDENKNYLTAIIKVI